MPDAVQISFDCLPLRAVGRFDIPLDASAEYRARCERLQQAVEKYAEQNAYYLLSAHCVFHLANSEVEGMLRFEFEGTVLTDDSDLKATSADLEIQLSASTCSEMPARVADWFNEMVARAVLIEFDRYIAAGTLAADVRRSEERRRQSDSDAAFIAMYL